MKSHLSLDFPTLRPFTISVGGVQFKVKFEEDLKAEFDEGIISLCGLCSADEQSIVLRSNMKLETLKISFYHEFFHAALSGISNGQPLSEEHVVELCARATREMIRQKSKLPSWLFS